MPKVHELLAVRSSKMGQARKLLGELATTFKSKKHLFEGRAKTFTPNGENAVAVVEEKTEIQTTVKKEIEWISKFLAQAVDVSYQVDLANCGARADVEDENGKTILKDVPAETLLELEKRLTEWKELIESIQTVDPAKSFVMDEASGHYKARDVIETRTKKGKKVYQIAKATDKHPEQAQLVDEDEPVGTILKQEWSALITPAQKADLLERAEDLQRAITKARSKANDYVQDIADKKIGETLIEYVFRPLEKA